MEYWGLKERIFLKIFSLEGLEMAEDREQVADGVQ